MTIFCNGEYPRYPAQRRVSVPWDWVSQYQISSVLWKSCSSSVERLMFAHGWGARDTWQVNVIFFRIVKMTNVDPSVGHPSVGQSHVSWSVLGPHWCLDMMHMRMVSDAAMHNWLDILSVVTLLVNKVRSQSHVIVYKYSNRDVFYYRNAVCKQAQCKQAQLSRGRTQPVIYPFWQSQWPSQQTVSVHWHACHG